MKTLKHIINCSLAVIAALVFASCNAIYDDEGDCSVQYRVRFLDDINLKYADAFDAEVTSMSLYVFDENENLLWSTYRSDELFADGDFFHSVDISHLSPGKYHVVAWGGIQSDASSFSVPNITRDPVRLQDLTCSLKRTSRADQETDLVDTDINDLFYGTADIEIPADDEAGMHTFDIHLTKDTHRVTVILQQINGRQLSADDYEFVIEAGNGHINHDNRLLYDEKRFVYRAYDTQVTDAGLYGEDTSYGNASAVVARLTISRLEINDWDTYTRPSLTIYNTHTGGKLLSIPLIDYLLLVRSYYHNVSSDQDYLDRQDEFNFTFFINEGTWLNSEILINSWRVVLNNPDLE
jgi:hypothetical protein